MSDEGEGEGGSCMFPCAAECAPASDALYQCISAVRAGGEYCDVCTQGVGAATLASFMYDAGAVNAVAFAGFDP